MSKLGCLESTELSCSPGSELYVKVAAFPPDRDIGCLFIRAVFFASCLCCLSYALRVREYQGVHNCSSTGYRAMSGGPVGVPLRGPEHFLVLREGLQAFWDASDGQKQIRRKGRLEFCIGFQDFCLRRWVQESISEDGNVASCGHLCGNIRLKFTFRQYERSGCKQGGRGYGGW